METQQNIIFFIDPVGFNVIAEKVNQTEHTITVKNPAVLQAAPNNTNQLQVQLLPVLFREFVDTSVRNNGILFTYPINRVVLTNAVLEERLRAQYIQMFVPPNQPAQQAQEEPKVVKLFDE